MTIEIPSVYTLALPYCAPLDVAMHLARDFPIAYLDSAKGMPQFGNISYIGLDPFHVISATAGDVLLDQVPVAGEDPLSLLAQYCQRYPLQPISGMPALQGGLIGYLGYEAQHYIEQLPITADPIGVPDVWFGFYDLILAFDHASQQLWICSSGYPEQDPNARPERAQQRAAWLAEHLTQVSPAIPASLPTFSALQSNFSKHTYMQAVREAQQHILAGDIFEVNISQQWHTLKPAELSELALYQAVRAQNPAPFGCLLQMGTHSIISASPERFLKIYNGKVEACPIKGTSASSEDPLENNLLIKALQSSAKDRAENIMIVDLMRNDLSRVCQPHTVTVDKLCEVESFESIHHLVSTISGQLKEKHNVFDVLRATFPPGSVTGAPKISAMEIIAEIEQQSRGPYCGCLGYIGFDGNADLSVSIRMMTLTPTSIYLSAGGAVVVDSDPELEYQETLAKSVKLKQALGEDAQS